MEAAVPTLVGAVGGAEPFLCAAKYGNPINRARPEGLARHRVHAADRALISPLSERCHRSLCRTRIVQAIQVVVWSLSHRLDKCKQYTTSIT